MKLTLTLTLLLTIAVFIAWMPSTTQAATSCWNKCFSGETCTELKDFRFHESATFKVLGSGSRLNAHIYGGNYMDNGKFILPYFDVYLCRDYSSWLDIGRGYCTKLNVNATRCLNLEEYTLPEKYTKYDDSTSLVVRCNDRDDTTDGDTCSEEVFMSYEVLKASIPTAKDIPTTTSLQEYSIENQLTFKLTFTTTYETLTFKDQVKKALEVAYIREINSSTYLYFKSIEILDIVPGSVVIKYRVDFYAAQDRPSNKNHPPVVSDADIADAFNGQMVFTTQLSTGVTSDKTIKYPTMTIGSATKPSSSSSDGLPLPAIIGIAVGGLLVIGVVVAVVLYTQQKKKQSKTEPETETATVTEMTAV